MAKTLVVRLSSLGDIAISIPVVYSVAKAYPGEQFVLLTKASFKDIFLEKPSNLKVIPVFTKTKHKGLKGLWKLTNEIGKVDQVADLHQILRSRLLSFYYRCKGKQVARIDKGRKEKKALTHDSKKKHDKLKSTIERYQDVFDRLGFHADICFTPFFSKERSSENGYKVGIAPYARHKGKMYPIEKTEEVIRILSGKENLHIFLFGGKEEKKLLSEWEKKYPNTRSLAGMNSFEKELQTMSQLDVMLSMDSANMHLASLVGTPVISIWGATHPDAGFYPFNQDISLAIQKDLACRPCSIYGNKECFRKDYHCLHSISPTDVANKVSDFLAHKTNI